MWIRNLYGALVNLNNTHYVTSSDMPVGSSSHSVMTVIDGNNRHVLFAGTQEKCQEYMAELEKELAAFGKLVKVEVGE